ncbi:putative lipase atg15 [Coemansia spiralis]|uniref:triacylglycerol lipase n=2 Tax=Coemansia TaxID=4863 RepID=A0A9W8G8Y4_9FUNG|nr:Alpha/Beta hydrolase protein [Coemansia spiralis]KAJ1993368.1 putative lipase atg15 [Coemansia umbellata]KAJ2623482.1 putative lipase atg15 [Coemansia sp. RSA 1358]KAJ2678948.1 putative lipase atg15 [Coemansia spiralis]
MGKPEAIYEAHEQPQQQEQQQKQTSSAWRAFRVLLVSTVVLSLLAGYFGGPIQMIPWNPGHGTGDGAGRQPSTPVLSLREVYIQSTPKPPSSLVTLSAQGTHAGKMALRAWYDDQAALARQRGYGFPYRLSRWENGNSANRGAKSQLSSLGIYQRVATELKNMWMALFGYSVSSADIQAHSQPDAQYTISFSSNEQPAAPMKIVASSSRANALSKSSGPEKVVARGTSKVLHQMRAQYLQSDHGRRHSYWSETPVRGMNASNYYYNSNQRFSRSDDPEDGDKPKPPEEEDPGVGRWSYYIEDGLLVPNVTHKNTLVHMARMAANAYQPVDSDTWERLGDRWDTHDSFGWVGDGLRGHVFADNNNKTVVISLKGTSSTFFLGGGSETSARDKYNDNRLFSCCCGYIDFTWSTVCDCHMSGSKCNATCLQNEMNDEAADNYFFAAAQIFMDVVSRYPDSDIIFTGHSLGGSIAGLLGLTFGLPTVAFEAPGDKLPAKRLHLPMPPSMIMDRLPLFHIGNTADPVFMGVCSGRTSSCYFAGYAMESKCHNGRQLIFDTVMRRNWRMDIRHHRINEVIYLVFEPWGNTDPEEEFPMLQLEDKDCVNCGLWKFIDNDSPQ